MALPIRTASATASFRAARACASGAKAPSASTISTDPSEPAPTIISKDASDASVTDGDVVNESSEIVHLAQPTLVKVGTEDNCNAAEQAWTAKVCASCSPSYERTHASTWTSPQNPSTTDGRKGRSISRHVRI